jgi:hypothetical protein|tara:strand:- start:2561 stop:2845 length:285 start_codon:yes stop_codon:yes gene_type:complete
VKRITIKEIKKWFKSLEENRYKKTYYADARRVAHFINNGLNEADLPESMKKKWKFAEYKREKYLANKYIKERLQEDLREAIRKEILMVKKIDEK